MEQLNYKEGTGSKFKLNESGACDRSRVIPNEQFSTLFTDSLKEQLSSWDYGR